MNRTALLRQYADILSPLKSGWEIKQASKAFKVKHGIGEGHPLHAALDEIFGVHDRRVGGLGSPVDCDAVTAKVIG